MTDPGLATDESAIDPQRFREVLGHYPTGVVLVTAIGDDGAPVGMAVGTFASVSLDPPLVAFLPDKRSSTFPRLRTAGSFVVNVLGAGQEQLCRTFGSKHRFDKWAGVSWHASQRGAPILDDAVAWIDCDLDEILDGGDHHIVLGRVRDLDLGRPDSPLLFFQGGYGRFASGSIVAPSESGLIGPLRVVDLARSEMERLAHDTGLECLAHVEVDGELVLVASAGAMTGSASGTRVGVRIPAVPPYGALFAAWGGRDAVDRWLGRLSVPPSPEVREAYERYLAVIRDQGWMASFGTLDDRVREAEDQLYGAGEASAFQLEEMRRLIEGLDPQPTMGPVDPERVYDVRYLTAPVFGPDGDAAVVLRLYGINGRLPGHELLALRDHLLAATDAVTGRLGGRRPREPRTP